MFNSFREIINKYLFSGSERSVLVKKNIIASFIIKTLNIGIGIAIVPITINYLNPTKYGIWITLSSIIGWFSFFDIGLGHGLRNHFTKSVSKKNYDLARVYVSTTYAILTIIVLFFLIVFYIVNPHLNWNKILNVEDLNIYIELRNLATIVFTFFCLRFVFKLITTILIADQRPAKASLFELIGRLLSFIFILLLTRFTDGSLLFLGIVMSVSPLIVLIIISIYYFNGKYKNIKPSFKYIDFSKSNDLLSLGVKFFLIQIASVLLYQTNNIIISHLLSPAEVTVYNIAFKYFNILLMGFAIVVMPFWSAITEAYAKNDLKWINSIIKKLRLIWCGVGIFGIFMLIISQWIYKIWIGPDINIPIMISLLVLIWILINTWTAIYSNFLNGVSKIKLQFYLSLSSAVLNVPLAIIFGKKFGVEGILFANNLIMIVGVFVYPLQYKKIVSKTDFGIWSK
jgi:O-antigen/teichoic acid export membrane protein